MGGGGSKEEKKVFDVKKMDDEDSRRREKIGLGPAPKNPIVKARAKVVGNDFYPFMKEQAEREVLMSPVVFSFDAPDAINENVFEKSLLGNLSKMENYGWLPVEVIHNLLLFMETKDLLACCLSCKLVHRIFSTNFFWKSYYVHFYKEKVETLKIEDDHFNWKKQFFKRFSGIVTDTSMRDTLNPSKMKSEEIEVFLKSQPNTNYNMNLFAMHNNSGPQNFVFMMVGKKGIGKRSLVHQLTENEFYPEGSELKDEYYFKTSPRRDDTTTNNDGRPIPNPNVLHFTGFGGGINYLSVNRILFSNTEDTKPESLSETFANGFFLCFSLDDHGSFKALKKYEKCLKKIEERKDGAGEAPKGQHRYNVILVGFKSDLDENERKVKREEVRVFVKKNNFKGYVECSAKNNCNVFLPFGLMLNKALVSKQEERPMIMTEMPMMPPTQINFDPMMLTQQII